MNSSTAKTLRKYANVATVGSTEAQVVYTFLKKTWPTLDKPGKRELLAEAKAMIDKAKGEGKTV
jgi:hypothetical protein